MSSAKDPYSPTSGCRTGLHQCLLRAALPVAKLRTRGAPEKKRKQFCRRAREVCMDTLSDLSLPSNWKKRCRGLRTSRQVNEGERSVVSMRDVGRAARVFKWQLGADPLQLVNFHASEAHGVHVWREAMKVEWRSLAWDDQMAFSRVVRTDTSGGLLLKGRPSLKLWIGCHLIASSDTL